MVWRGLLLTAITTGCTSHIVEAHRVRSPAESHWATLAHCDIFHPDNSQPELQLPDSRCLASTVAGGNPRARAPDRRPASSLVGSRRMALLAPRAPGRREQWA